MQDAGMGRYYDVLPGIFVELPSVPGLYWPVPEGDIPLGVTDPVVGRNRTGRLFPLKTQRHP